MRTGTPAPLRAREEAAKQSSEVRTYRQGQWERIPNCRLDRLKSKPAITLLAR